MQKKCPRCELMLDESEFNWKIKNVRRAIYCRTCSRAYIKNHYYNNRSYYIEKAKKRNKLVGWQRFEYIRDYLLSHQCVDCGEKNLVVLDFDHRDRKEKLAEVSIHSRKRWSLKRLITEINKCDIRCANCHRIKTAKENNSWKLKYMHP